MTDLKALEKRLPGGKAVAPRAIPFANFLLYGPSGSGKTTGAASAPGPVLYLNAESENSLYYARQKQSQLLAVKVDGWKTLLDIGKEVKEHAEDWGTVVIDPISDVYRMLIEEDSNMSLNPALDTYRDAGTRIERWCRGMCAQPINFVVVAHDWPVKDESSGEVERLPYTGSNSNPTLANKLLAMMDINAYCGRVEKKEEGSGETSVSWMAQLVNANGRRGKDRFNVLGKTAELNLTEWLAKIAESKKPKEAKAA